MSSVMHTPARRHAAAGGRVTGVGAAVVLATTTSEDGGPSAAQIFDGEPLLARVLEQLAGLGLTGVTVLTRPAFAAALSPITEAAGAELVTSDSPREDLRQLAALAEHAHGGVIVAQGDVVCHREALASLLADPRIATGALVTGGNAGRPFAFKLRARRGRIVSAGSAYHAVHNPNAAFLGLLKVAAADRAALAAVAGRLAPAVDDPSAEWTAELEAKRGAWARAWEHVDDDTDAVAAERDAARSMELDLAAQDDPDHAPADPDAGAPIDLSPEELAELDRRVAAATQDVASLLLVGLVRADVVVRFSNLRRLHWSRPLSADALERSRARIANFDEDAALRASAVKASDGFFTTYFVSPYSQYIARWCARRGITPNQITVASLIVGIAAALLFATGERAGLIAGAILLQFAFTLDCVDGQTARYTRTFSRLGAWLDSVFDRSKEYLAYAGLAAGAAAQGDPVWYLACAALTLQTARHAIDFSYPTSQPAAQLRLTFPPLSQSADGEQPHRAQTPAPSRLKRLAREANRVQAVVWAKKIMMFPIGERFAVISILAATTNARAVFVVLLAWGGFATAYVVAGRLLRAVRGRAGLTVEDHPERLGALRDDGPLAQLVGALARPLPGAGWLLTAAGALPVLVAAVWTGASASPALAAGVCAWFVLVAGAAAGRGEDDTLRWLVPPLLRAGEFTAIAWLAAQAGEATGPATYALLCAVAFHHYDVVYRLRQRGDTPPAWVTAAGLGWEGRVILVALVALLPTATVALWVIAAALAVLYVTEAVRGWIAYGRRDGTVYDEEDDA